MGGTNRDFDGKAGVDAVLVVEIDAIQVEALQAGLTGGSHIRWIATYLPLPIHMPESELSCQFHLLSHPSLQSLPAPQGTKSKKKRTTQTTEERKKKRWDLSEKDFVGEGAVHVGGVEEGDTGVDGVVDERDHVFFGLAGHAHATEALCGHLQSLRTQLYPPHSSGCHFFLSFFPAAEPETKV
jgi:hypothetical protein